MFGLNRITLPLLLAGSVVGCVGGTTASSPSGASAPASVASPTLAAAAPDPTSLIGLEIDARRVLSTAGIDCTGGPLGGEASESMSYDVWTLHCPAGPETASSKLVKALKGEVELLGAAIQDEGEIVSHNAGNDGDRQVTLHCGIEGIDVSIRITSLKAGDGSVVVVTIDQRRL